MNILHILPHYFINYKPLMTSIIKYNKRVSLVERYVSMGYLNGWQSDIRLAITWPAEGEGCMWLIASYRPPVNCQIVNTSADHRQHGIVTPELPVSSLPHPTTHDFLSPWCEQGTTCSWHCTDTLWPRHMLNPLPTSGPNKSKTKHTPWSLPAFLYHISHTYANAFYTPRPLSTPVIGKFQSDTKCDRRLLFHREWPTVVNKTRASRNKMKV